MLAPEGAAVDAMLAQDSVSDALNFLDTHEPVRAPFYAEE
jgi:hypothetical protein